MSPFLYFLYTYDCVALFSSNQVVKFADDTTVIGLITNEDETAYRKEVENLAKWCSAPAPLLVDKGRALNSFSQLYNPIKFRLN